MARINKNVIKDYFGSFFKQYSPVPKELFSKIRSLVDEAECGCCDVVTVYWLNDGDVGNFASPTIHQVRFKNAGGDVLASTVVGAISPQRVCVPEGATQLCINVLGEFSNGDDGTVNATGTDGTFASTTNTVSEDCSNFSGLQVLFPDDIFPTVIVTATVTP